MQMQPVSLNGEFGALLEGVTRAGAPATVEIHHVGRAGHVDECHGGAGATIQEGREGFERQIRRAGPARGTAS